MFSLVKMRLMLIVAFGCFLSTGYTQKRISSFKFEKMLVEYAENPINIDTKHPRFSWIISSPQRNQVQSAYQLMVATSAYLLSHNHPDLWNSGKVIRTKPSSMNTMTIISDQTVPVIGKSSSGMETGIVMKAL